MRPRGSVPEEYWGCRTGCWSAGKHSRVFGECSEAEPVCDHPVDAICWESDGSEIVCGDCREGLSIEKLAEAATVGLSMGCTCPGDTCGEKCGNKPVAWTLDPAKVLMIWRLEKGW